MNKTIQQLWDETPWPEPIKDQEYREFVEWFIQNSVWDLLFYPNIPPHTCIIHEKFEIGWMTVEKAKRHLECILEKNKKRKEEDHIRYNRLHP